MFTIEKTRTIEKHLSSIETSLDAFHGSLQLYKESLNSKTPAMEEKSPLVPQKKNSHHREGGGISLFEGLLRDFIREHAFEINSDTEEEANYTIIKENTPDAVVEMDTDGRIISINPSFTNTFEYRESELQGTSFFLLTPDEYHNGLRESMRNALHENFGKYQNTVDDILVFRALTKAGQPKSVETILYAYEKNGQKVLVLLLRDLSLSRSLYDELQEARDNYDALSETISETIIRIDENFSIIFVNAAIQKTFGYLREEIYGQHFSILFPPGVFERNRETFRKYFLVDDQHRKEIGLEITIEVLGNSKHRGLFPMEMSFGNSKEYHGRTMTCILRDITQRKHNERKLRHLAYHDKLTGLGNRDLFGSDIHSLFHTMEENRSLRSALMFLDLDGFKGVNDTLGHEAGDILLVETARRLRNHLRDTDSVYRFGGDEFVVLLRSIQTRDNAALVGTKLLDTIREPFDIPRDGKNTTVSVGVSIGIAMIPDDGEKPEVATKNADLAMYSAKEAGKNTFVFYKNDMNQRVMEKWELEQGLKQGLARREFILHYQPLVDKQGKILGVEALVRWNHPVRGLVSPGFFIQAAEENGLIIPMGNWILETACRTMQALNSGGYPDLFISVNLSPRQFEHPDFLDITGNIIRKTGINPENLKLELTETCIMKNPETAIEKMHSLKNRHPGVSISIDDFGTGYSSLSYLSQFPADIIKIDLSFVLQLFVGTNQKIVNAIITLAQSMELNVVAEGVETQRQLDYFVEKGCQMFQGFYFHEPLDYKILLAMLEKESD